MQDRWHAFATSMLRVRQDADDRFGGGRVSMQKQSGGTIVADVHVVRAYIHTSIPYLLTRYLLNGHGRFR